jgi:hypothetical protein
LIRKEKIMEFTQYIAENTAILIPTLWVAGQIFKKIPKIPNWIIPLTLMFLGIIGAGSTMGWTPDAVIQGVLVAGGAVLVDQVVKQVRERKN